MSQRKLEEENICLMCSSGWTDSNPLRWTQGKQSNPSPATGWLNRLLHMVRSCCCNLNNHNLHTSNLFTMLILTAMTSRWGLGFLIYLHMYTSLYTYFHLISSSGTKKITAIKDEGPKQSMREGSPWKRHVILLEALMASCLNRPQVVLRYELKAISLVHQLTLWGWD